MRQGPKQKRKVSPQKITEAVNPASASLETKPLAEVLRIINREDCKVALAVNKVIPQITQAAEIVVRALDRGGRLVYMGAGTSGRMGALDAAECFPTFGTRQVIAVLAGGPAAMLRSVEGAEDDEARAVRDLRKIKLSNRDVLIGIAASGSTPYTCAGLGYARRLGLKTIALTSNPGSPVTALADVSIVPVTGPEIVAGSTRMKAGTAQKLVLNMLSTASMVGLGKVYAGLMVNVQLTNRKLRQRAIEILMKTQGVSVAEAARAITESNGKLPVALVMLAKGVSSREAARLVRQNSLVKLLRPRPLRAKK
ncbi:MAG TPA: N-acetylmuramic acid 6-phosphate etherase [Terriglobia bacterium]|nr:N-acetylmuramic acid 6-phosphate etherase [Terriglobia bacterium]